VTRVGVVTARYQGPFAVGDDLRRFSALTWMLATTDFKLRFFGSVLGYLWTLLRPLLLFGVLYVVFTLVLHIGQGVPFYPAYLLTGIVLWTFFAEATAGSVTALVARENMLRKVRFPRLVVPLAVSLMALFNFTANFVAVLVFVLITGVQPRLSWLAMVPLVALLVLLAAGVGMLLSALYVRYRDIEPMWAVVLQALFYATPIIYVITRVPHAAAVVLMCNPVASIVTEMRHVFIDPSAPTAAALIGGAPRLLVPAGAIVVVFALGLWVFNRETPRIAENL
jgi:ABC-2 type transport system permease protein